MTVSGSLNINYLSGGVTGSGNLFYGTPPTTNAFGATIVGVLRQVTSGSTNGVVGDDLIVDLPGSGIGISGTGSPPSPDLAAQVYGDTYSSVLSGSIEAAALQQGSTGPKPSGTLFIDLPGSGLGILEPGGINLDLCSYIYGDPYSESISGTITGSLAGTLYASIYPSMEGSNTLSGNFIRGTIQEEEDLPAIIYALASGNYGLPAVIRPTISGEADLYSSIFCVEPVDLLATITGNSFNDLTATISSVTGVDLFATISGKAFKPLLANIQGYDELDLMATITGNSFSDLTAKVSGIASDQINLLAEINADELDRLFCSISGVVSGFTDLSAYYEAIPPVDLSGQIYPVPPVPITGIINPIAPPEEILATVTGILRQDQLGAVISSTGGFYDLYSIINGTIQDESTLSAVIDPNATLGLSAVINAGPQDNLNAVITPSGPYGSTQLSAEIKGQAVESLSATISGEYFPPLYASYNPIDGIGLKATIYPNVYYIDTLIPINTYGFNELSAQINANVCLPKSDFTTIGAIINPNYKGDLSANIVGINNLVKAVDLLTVDFNKKYVTKDFLQVKVDPPSIATDYLTITILNAPYGDLMASIFGVQATSTLDASITPNVVGSFYTADPSTGIWVNPATGERKIIRFVFSLTGKTYYYSEVANKTFPESFKNKIKLIIETYSDIDQDEDVSPTMLGIRTNIRRCEVSDLSCFNSWDEAVKFGIQCAAGMFDDLVASITATGGSAELPSSINGLDDRDQAGLPAKIVPVGNQPIIGAEIESQGGFLDENAFIRGFGSGQTTPPSAPSNQLNIVKTPVMITFNGAGPQIILQDLVTSGNIVYSNTPDLHAFIRGTVEDNFNATITGTP